MPKRSPIEAIFWNYRMGAFNDNGFANAICYYLRPANAEEFRQLAKESDWAVVRDYVSQWPTADSEWEALRAKSMFDGQGTTETIQRSRPGVETFRKLMAGDTTGQPLA
jgi:hypothetical protein